MSRHILYHARHPGVVMLINPGYPGQYLYFPECGYNNWKKSRSQPCKARQSKANPVVPVPKKDGTFRIYGDFKVTLNPALEIGQQPIPKPEDIFASLAGGELFTMLNLSQAYQQLLLDEESSELVTVNTHLGLYHTAGYLLGLSLPLQSSRGQWISC